MEINVYNLPDYCQIDSNSLIIKNSEERHWQVLGKYKIEVPMKLELHLRNSEVVGIPTVISEGTKLISHSIFKPLQGTHDNLYLTFEVKDNVFTLLKDELLVTFIFVSKHFWRLMLRKDIEGLNSVPVKINQL